MMKARRSFSWFLLISLIVSQTVFAFVIEKIDIRGLQGITKETVLSYLPVDVGDQFDLSDSAAVIEALYKTRFFNDVRVSKQNNTLVIDVEQRPVLDQIVITGNKAIPTKNLKEALRQTGLIEGEIFDPTLLEKIKVSLVREYFSIGKYTSTVDTEVVPEARNRVNVKIMINEGKTAKIRQINIIGNHAFVEKELLNQFILSKTTLLSLIKHNDQYSREKLAADLETLRAYYLDHGFLKFDIDSTQVSMSPDKSKVYITIHIVEGSQYTLSDYTFEGSTVLPVERLKQLVRIKTGSVFSRQAIMAATKHITDVLGEKGYSGAHVDVVPTIDENAHSVLVTFAIKPGPRVYVRRITVSDHHQTNDNVLRREILQQEGALLSTTNINASKRFLLLLPYIRDVQVETIPVAGESDQVDLNYKVTEHSAAELRAGIGYSQLDKFLINFGLNHPNILGTGNSLGLSAMHSRSSTNLSFSYYNPYVTPSGIGRSFNIYASRFNADEVNITTYATDTYGADIGYNVKISPDDSLFASLGYEDDLLKIGTGPSDEVQDFVDEHGQRFYQMKLTAGWTHQGLNRNIFPTAGLMQSFNAMMTAPISHKSLEYYRLNYNAVYYHPLYKKFIAQLHGEAHYGNGYGRYSGDDLPFFKNFYAGGIGSIRGYSGNTLGPRDSNGDAIGGNFEINGTIGLVVPNPLTENLRTTLFVDGGNVYRSNDIRWNEMRYSTGIQFDWLSPIGLLNFSFAKALHTQPNDDKEFFQFTIGTSF